jgi:hypothetical protein
MKKVTKPRRRATDDILPEYDFSGGVRGKYAARYAQGTNVVVLDADVAAAFPTATDVNNALRGLVNLARATGARRRGTRKRA